MTPGGASVPKLDELCRARRISGYTVEPSAGYLRARRPTLTYRAYHDATGIRNASRLVADLRALGAHTHTAAGAIGNLGMRTHIQRTRQVVVTASFREVTGIGKALTVVRNRYHAAATRPVAGSWWLPDLRLTGCGDLPGTIPVVAHALRTRGGVAVTLTLWGGHLLPGARVYPASVLDDWWELLGSETIAA